MIDIHSHILPKMDDGARSMDEALKMAAIAFADGIQQMVCTPHLFNGLSKNPLTSEIEERVSELQNAIGATGLKVFPGSEVRVTSGVVKQAQEKLLTTLNGKTYILVELPTPSVPRGTRSWFRKLKLQGVNPILVHPERNIEIQRYPWIVADLVADGVLTQVTAMSVAGQFGTAAKVCADSLLRHNCVHFLATDTHRPEKRPPVLSRGRDAAAAIVGADAARLLVEDNPLAVVTGEPIVPAPVIPYEKPSGSTRSFLGRIFSR
ncbi:MAG TPA: CpsB/CapC family capsule biosynthesis tyrosine phosphatase [Terriglobia bacterium]|nr:CpsB/CapC family capsule biosynthesis tyrosine phosphatase [Terriglobia bacterium]